MNITERTVHTRSLSVTLDDAAFRQILAERVAKEAGVSLTRPGVTYRVHMESANYGGLGSASEQRARVEITVDLEAQPACSASS